MEEEMRVCPFDPQHRVCSSRFEIHLSKCQKQHPNKVVFCPFNAKHVLTSFAKLNNHLIECPDNNRIEYELKLNEIMNVLEQEKKAVEPDHKIDLTAIETENWDAEIKPSPMTSDMPTIGICYANMTRKQRKELNQKQIEAFNKKQNYSSSR